ncbi:MAG: DUF4190 and DUF4352 domain-containing protein [Atopobiaceae bacterium]|nr:DUF4190 and DUF4352 domain-containing protein [Atopobiaceae bacterium]
MTDTAQQPKTSSGLAVAGLVLGILAAVTSFLPIINNLSFFIALIGGILSAIALIGALRGKHTAKGMSIAGVVLAVVSIVIVLVTQSAFKAVLDSASEELQSSSQPVAASEKKEEEAEADVKAEEETKSTESASDEKAKEEAKAEDKEDAEEEADYSSMSIGQSVELKSGLNLTVNSVEPFVGKYNSDDPTVCVNVTYVNNGDSNESFNTFDWKVVDANGVESSQTFVLDGEDELKSGQLQPGGTVSGNVYFEGSPVKVLYYSNMFNSEASIGWVVE